MTSIHSYYSNSATHTRHVSSHLQEIGDMDPDTAALIAKLVRDDLEDATISVAKGKSRANSPLSDEELAYRLQRENFEELLTLADDIKYAQDVSYLEAARAAEVAAYDDRRAAEILSQGKPMPPLTAAQRLLERPEFKMHPVCNLSPIAPTAGKGKGKAKDPEDYREHYSDFRDAEDKRREDRDWPMGLKGVTYNHTAIEPDRYEDKSRSPVDDLVPGPSAPSNKGNSNLQADCIICESDNLIVASAVDAAYKKYYCHNCVVSLITATASTVKAKRKGRGRSEGGANA